VIVNRGDLAARIQQSLHLLPDQGFASCQGLHLSDMLPAGDLGLASIFSFFELFSALEQLLDNAPPGLTVAPGVPPPWGVFIISLTEHLFLFFPLLYFNFEFKEVVKRLRSVL
jgi:hypothetical protein